MRQLWTAVLLLVLLSAALLAAGRQAADLAGSLLEELPQAAAAAEAGDWTEAQARTGRAAETWEEAARWLLLAESHQAVEEVGCLLEEAAVWAGVRDAGSYRTAVRRACRALRVLSEGERVTLGNLF